MAISCQDGLTQIICLKGGSHTLHPGVLASHWGSSAKLGRRRSAQ